MNFSLQSVTSFAATFLKEGHFSFEKLTMNYIIAIYYTHILAYTNGYLCRNLYASVNSLLYTMHTA